MTTEIASLLLAAIQTGVILVSTALLLYQLRQFNHSLRQDSYGKQLEFSLRINELLLQHKAVADQFYQNNSEYTSLDDDQQEFYHYLILIFDVYERFYLLFLSKRLEKKAWQSWERWLVHVIFRLDLFPLCWRNERRNFHEDFCRYIDAKYEQQQMENRLRKDDEKNRSSLAS